MKIKSFTIVELIFSISLITIAISTFNFKNHINKLHLAKKQLLLHLRYARYIAMLDNFYDKNDPLWFRKRWRVKFLRCDKKIGGIYYVIYSDSNKNGHISKEETLKDPLTNNYIYSYQCHQDTIYDKSNFVLLTQQYDITDIKISCNDTTSLGQIIFGNNGNIFTKLSTKEYQSSKYTLKNNCFITLIDKNNNQETITITPTTGYIF